MHKCIKAHFKRAWGLMQLSHLFHTWIFLQIKTEKKTDYFLKPYFGLLERTGGWFLDSSWQLQQQKPLRNPIVLPHVTQIPYKSQNPLIKIQFMDKGSKTISPQNMTAMKTSSFTSLERRYFWRGITNASNRSKQVFLKESNILKEISLVLNQSKKLPE